MALGAVVIQPIILRNGLRTNGCFFHCGKSQCLQGAHHPQGFCHVKAPRKTWCQADHHRSPSKPSLNLVHITGYLLGILRADLKAIATPNTQILYDLGLMLHNPNGFYRTGPNTLVAVFTIGFVKINHAHQFVSMISSKTASTSSILTL